MKNINNGETHRYVEFVRSRKRDIRSAKRNYKIRRAREITQLGELEKQKGIPTDS